MKNKIIGVATIVILMILNACHEDRFDPTDNHAGQWVANYTLSELNARVRVPKYEEMLSFYDVQAGSSNGRIQQQHSTPDQNYALVLRAEVEPPTYKEHDLRASHVEIDGNRAFVVYNTEGEDYLGGIDIFDISDIKNPVLVSQIIIDGSDFSAVAFHDQKIYLAGAALSPEENGLKSPAIVEILELENDHVTDASTILDVMGFVATDVKIHEDKLYVTSGSNGGLCIYDLNTLALLDTKPLDDARSIAFDQDQFVVMQGTPARVTTYNTADGALLQSFTVGGANVPESKSIVAMQNNLIFVPAGADGLKVIDASTGESKLMIPLPPMEDVEPDFLVTNGVSVNGEKIFIANGAAGLYVAQQQGEEVAILGNVYFNASTNYVKSKDNVMFVATGTGGLKILEIVEYDPGNGDYIPIGGWDDEGVPDYLCERAGNIDPALTDKIFGQFISMDDITLRHPEWFADGVVTDLPFIEDTDLSITFFHEGAGLKNTLGYYLFDTNHMPQTADELQNLTVLFPNVSYQGKGGGLLRGDKICMSGLKAGTTLGFFLVTNGWDGSSLRKGPYVHHTTLQFNVSHPPGMKQNSLLLFDEDSGTLILTFEDVRRPGGDKDFDDAVFLIKLSNPNAIDKSKLTQLQ